MLPNIENALSLVDAPQIIGLGIVGLIFGWVIFSLAAFDTRTASTVLTMSGVVYFVFVIVIRYASGPLPVAERTIGTGLLWLVFSLGATLGLMARRRLT